ncbi:hypothetical protein ACFV9E_06630 [Streptomyces sp. NPDC059835]|uniref:hypothetical protein n=1 Tax=Streptomyces sp. NPDC059835 TaxID=3346967 RepID=UPI003667F8EA
MTDFDRLTEIEDRAQCLSAGAWRQRSTDTGIIEDAQGHPVAILGTSGAARLPLGEFFAHAPVDVRWLANELRTAWGLLAEAQLDFATEFRVPVPVGSAGGYAEVVVRRDDQGEMWAVSDGALTGLRAWVDGRWSYVSDIGRAAAFRWTREEAIAVAQEVAELEAGSYRQAAATATNTSSAGRGTGQ